MNAYELIAEALKPRCANCKSYDFINGKCDILLRSVKDNQEACICYTRGTLEDYFERKEKEDAY